MSILWTADTTAEQGGGWSWASINDPSYPNGFRTDVAGVRLPSSRISVDTTTKPSNATGAYKFTVQTGDVDGTSSGQRSELGQGNPTRADMLSRLFNLNDEVYIGFQIRLDSTFPLNPGTWNLVMQFKQLGSFGSPVLSLGVRDNVWRFDRTSNDPANETLSPAWHDVGPAQTGVWVKFLVHEKLHTDPAIGFYEVYGDLGDGGGYRLLQPRTMQATMKISNDSGTGYPSGSAVPVHLRSGIYRNRTIAGNAAFWLSNVVVATTKAEAETAFDSKTIKPAAEFGAAAVTNFATRTSMALSNPAGVADGDLIFAFAGLQGDRSRTVVTPAGWNQLFAPYYSAGTAYTGAFYWRVFRTSDAAPTITWGGTSISSAGLMWYYTRQSRSSPVVAATPAASTGRAPSVTGPTAERNMKVVWIDFLGGSSVVAPPTLFTTRVYDPNESGLVIGDRVFDAGAVGSLTGTSTNSIAHSTFAFGIRMRGGSIEIFNGTTWTAYPAEVFDGTSWAEAVEIAVL